MVEQTTFGKYQLRERINVGGMAEVFLADVDSDAGFAGPVALKRVLPNISRNKEFISMFIDEARLSVQLNHGGIAQVLDIGQVDDSYFIALEHVDGKDLGAVIMAARKQKQPLPLPLACYIASKICEALHYAHNKKDPSGHALDLVHRDVSPSNVLISYKGDIKVTDFGLAKANGKATQTQAGVVKGKHGYMSPEQAQGVAIDRRSDIFSVGVCLYEMLTAQRLFKGESDFSTLRRVRAAEVPTLSAIDRRVPSELERIVSRMLARLPEERYATSEEAARDLQNFMADSGNLCGPSQLAGYMQRLFAIEAGAGRKLAAPKQTSDGLTGLAAFADLEPVSTVSALIELPDAPPPMLTTDAYDSFEVEAEAKPLPAIEKRAATLVGMPLPARTGDTEQRLPVFNDVAVGRSVPSLVNATPAQLRAPSLPPRAPSLPPPPRARTSSLPPAQLRTPSLPPPPAPRVSASVPPPAPRASASIPPPPPRASASIPPAALHASGPSVQLDWPEEELATTRLDDSRPFQLVDATEQIELPKHSVWDDQPTAAAVTDTFDDDDYAQPRTGLSDGQKAVGLTVAAVLLVGAAFVLLRGPDLSTLKLEVSPSDATVTLDGQQLATASPYMIEGLDPTQPHTLEVRKAGYSVWTSKVELQPGETMSLPAVTLDAEPKPVAAPVITAQPSVEPAVAVEEPSAHLAAAEENEVAPSPAPQKLTARQRRIAAKRAKATARAARVAARQPSRPAPRRATKATAARAKTSPELGGAGNGVLRINTQPWSKVFVDGRLVGNTPQMGIQLSAGRHRLTLVNEPLGIRKMVEVTIVADQTMTKIIQLAM